MSLADLAAGIAPLLDREQRHLRQQARLLWALPSFTEEVLQWMLRGQVLTAPWSRGGPPCLACGEPRQARQPRAQSQPDRTGSFWPVQQRGWPQTELCGAPLAPVPWPRNTLMCPMHESARNGDPKVPCTQALTMLPLPVAPDPILLPLQQEGGTGAFRPCMIVHELLQQVMPALLGLGSHQELEALGRQPPAALRQQARELAQEQAAAQGPTPQELRRGVRFLLGTGRLRDQELAEIIESGVMVTDANWLPCRHDTQRNVWISLADRMEPGAGGGFQARSLDRAGVPQARRRCPLQVRGLLGDRAAPCCEALDLEPDGEMLARLLPAEGLIPQRDRLPVIWETPAAEPGGPADPVRTLELRPCYLLGRLLGLTLHGAVREHLEKMEQPDREAELRDRDDLDDDLDPSDPDLADPN